MTSLIETFLLSEQRFVIKVADYKIHRVLVEFLGDYDVLKRDGSGNITNFVPRDKKDKTGAGTFTIELPGTPQECEQWYSDGLIWEMQHVAGYQVSRNGQNISVSR